MLFISYVVLTATSPAKVERKYARCLVNQVRSLVRFICRGSQLVQLILYDSMQRLEKKKKIGYFSDTNFQMSLSIVCISWIFVAFRAPQSG